jgi:hypothetical protein
MSGVFQNIVSPPPHRPASVYPPTFGAGGGHTRWVERGWGVNILEDARHSSVLYICKSFVGKWVQWSSNKLTSAANSASRFHLKSPESTQPSADRTGCEGTCRRQSGLMAGARWDHLQWEKLGEGATEDRAAQADLTTTMPPEAEARIEAEARTEDVDAAADPSAAAGPSGAGAAGLGENGFPGTSTGTGTVKSSNFVILFSENIFFHQTFFRWPYFVFRYWNLYRMCLASVHIYFALRQCLIPKILFFLRLTKLGGRHLISSPSQIYITKQRI